MFYFIFYDICIFCIFLWFLGFVTQTLNCILFYEVSYTHQGCIHLVRNMVKNNTTVKYYNNFNLTAFHSNVIIIIKLRWALFVTYTIIQSITSSEMSSLHLTHPSTHTLGAVGSRWCSARGAVGGSVPCSRVSPQSWTIPAGAEIWTHNLGLQVQRSIH